MSRLEELIAELCPEGVEYKLLPDVLKIQRGVRVVKKDLMENGLYPVYQNSLTPLGYYDKYNCEAGTTMIIVAGAAGDILYSNKRFWAADDCFYFVCNEESLISKFLYYALMVQQRKIYSKVRTASIPRLSRINIEKIRIPIPPLPVQREIVRILDNFTELTAKLTAELTARKKQYEYYRDKLLTFGDVRGGATSDVVWRMLGEICDVRDGTHDSPKPSPTGKYLITSKNVKNGTIDYTGAYLISDKDYEQINVRSKVDTWDILFTMIGTIGEIGMVAHEPDFTIKNVGLIKTGNELLSRFLRHYLVSDKVKAYIDANRSKGTQAFLALGKLRELPVPVVSEPVMKSLVQVLDNFDAICSDLKIGLPAEIGARKKQYEYYRDQLLTFAESGRMLVDRQTDRQTECD